jgi:hypothetical protein
MIQLGSKVKFKDGDPPDIGEVISIMTSSALLSVGIFVGSTDPNEVFADVKFPRFPQAWGWHRISILTEVSQ